MGTTRASGQAGDRDVSRDADSAPALPDQPDRSRRLVPPGSLSSLVVLAVILVGAAQRWWAAGQPIGTLTSDGAVIGLMALRLLHHGQLTAYMWGQSYGGSLEAAFTAAVFAIAGVGTSQLLVTTALSSALCAVALWRAGRPLVGEPAAKIAALAFWVWPASFLWRSVKPGGTYMIGLAIALCAVGALARICRGDRDWRRCALAGWWCGLALWSSPMSLELLIPATLWCLPAIVRLRWRLLAMAAGAAAGGLPALVFGAAHSWTNLHMPGYHADLISGFAGRFGQFFSTEAPIALGVRAEGSLAWLGGHLGEALAWAAAAALAATAAAVLTRRAPRCRLPVCTLALLPFLYAFIPLADHAGQGRYALFAVPMVALLIGTALTSTRITIGAGTTSRAGTIGRTAIAGLVLACALGTAGLHAEPGRELVAFPAPDVAMPINDSALLSLLAAHQVKDAYAPYWIAYRVMFETGGHTQVTPYDNDRYPPIAAAVAASPDPAYLLVTASRTVGALETWCHDRHIGYQAWHLGAFTIIRPAAHVSPSMLPEAVLR